ncbi:hypothetical protein [Nocardioides terrisoli]|uniref:hypothetical protein n=1 Tax=Nocardioides terrisoli TaxID=3388267 RepID=UPI00287B7878|nr:hypothetical protein [Nocardioides marmorisolisilvae]
MTSADALVSVADGLYALPAADFTAARDAAAKHAEREGEKDLARRIKALRRPTAAAWAVNLLIRREAGQIEQVLALGESLRAAAAAMQGDELRALTRQRRQLTTALATSARARAREYGVRLSDPVLEQVEGVLTGALLDPVAADVVRTGLLVTSFGATGVSEVDVDAVLAVPEAMGGRATPVAAPEPSGAESEDPRHGLRAVPEDDALRRARADDAVREAAQALAGARAEVEAAEAAVGEHDARRLQVHGEIEELRRRLDDLEEEADEAEVALEGAREDLSDARAALSAVEEAHALAVRRRQTLGE